MARRRAESGWILFSLLTAHSRWDSEAVRLGSCHPVRGTGCDECAAVLRSGACWWQQGTDCGRECRDAAGVPTTTNLLRLVRPSHPVLDFPVDVCLEAWLPCLPGRHLDWSGCGFRPLHRRPVRPLRPLSRLPAPAPDLQSGRLESPAAWHSRSARRRRSASLL